MLDGTWKSEDTWGGFADNMVNMAPFTNMPDDVKKTGRGHAKPPSSPAAEPLQVPGRRPGRQEVECKGKAQLADEQVLGMNFYVKGIDDKLPQ